MIPTRLLLYLAAVLIVIGAAATWSHTRYAAGAADRDAYWTIENQKAVAAAQKLLDAERAKVKTEHDQAELSLRDLAANYEARIAHENEAFNRRLAALRTGSERVRVAISPGSCGGATAGTSTAASGGDGQATAELLPAVAAGLVELAADADAIVNQLTLAQDTLSVYYRTCGPRPAQ